MKVLLMAVGLAAGLAAPAGAAAGTLDLVRGAKLQAVSGQMTLSETRCPPGGSAPACGHQKLTTSFRASGDPATSRRRGPSGFPLGVIVTGKGGGLCTTDSPPSVVTAPDGSMQILEGAQRIEPARSDSTSIAIGASARGARWAWLEPLAPGFACNYFDEPGTTLALPPSTGVPAAVTSPPIAPRVLRRARFTVRIKGSSVWSAVAQDGSNVTGKGDWELTLQYVRPPRRRLTPSFAARRRP